MIHFVVRQPERLENIHLASNHHIEAFSLFITKGISTPVVPHPLGGSFRAVFYQKENRVYYTNLLSETYEVVIGIPELLRKECEKVSKLLYDMDASGFYRNTSHSILNLSSALKILSEDGSLSDLFDASSSSAQFGSPQPNGIRQTLINALDPTRHGEIMQSREEMKKAAVDVTALDRAIHLAKVFTAC